MHTGYGELAAIHFRRETGRLHLAGTIRCRVGGHCRQSAEGRDGARSAAGQLGDAEGRGTSEVEGCPGGGAGDVQEGSGEKPGGQAAEPAGFVEYVDGTSYEVSGIVTRRCSPFSGNILKLFHQRRVIDGVQTGCGLG